MNNIENKIQNKIEIITTDDDNIYLRSMLFYSLSEEELNIAFDKLDGNVLSVLVNYIIHFDPVMLSRLNKYTIKKCIKLYNLNSSVLIAVLYLTDKDITILRNDFKDITRRSPRNYRYYLFNFLYCKVFPIIEGHILMGVYDTQINLENLKFLFNVLKFVVDLRCHDYSENYKLVDYNSLAIHFKEYGKIDSTDYYMPIRLSLHEYYKAIDFIYLKIINFLPEDIFLHILLECKYNWDFYKMAKKRKLEIDLTKYFSEKSDNDLIKIIESGKILHSIINNNCTYYLIKELAKRKLNITNIVVYLIEEFVNYCCISYPLFNQDILLCALSICNNLLNSFFDILEHNGIISSMKFCIYKKPDIQILQMRQWDMELIISDINIIHLLTHGMRFCECDKCVNRLNDIQLKYNPFGDKYIIKTIDNRLRIDKIYTNFSSTETYKYQHSSYDSTLLSDVILELNHFNYKMVKLVKFYIEHNNDKNFKQLRKCCNPKTDKLILNKRKLKKVFGKYYPIKYFKTLRYNHPSENETDNVDKYAEIYDVPILYKNEHKSRSYLLTYKDCNYISRYICKIQKTLTQYFKDVPIYMSEFVKYFVTLAKKVYKADWNSSINIFNIEIYLPEYSIIRNPPHEHNDYKYNKTYRNLVKKYNKKYNNNNAIIRHNRENCGGFYITLTEAKYRDLYECDEDTIPDYNYYDRISKLQCDTCGDILHIELKLMHNIIDGNKIIKDKYLTKRYPKNKYFFFCNKTTNIDYEISDLFK